MGLRMWSLTAAMAFFVSSALAQHATEFADNATTETTPLKLTLEPQGQPPSVYALPTAQPENQGVNAGGINLDMKVDYFSSYIYRGINRSDFISDVSHNATTDRANFQFDGRMEFNLGKLPHPFLGIFANVLDSDPVSNFQEVRPFFGANWYLRPLLFEVGDNIYEFPDRREFNTSEVWFKITLDDKALLNRDQPLLSPYIYAAYDYDLYNGWYIEFGVSHDFVIEGTGITLTPNASIAYVIAHGYFAGPTGEDTGFQHYQIGLTGKYSLNKLLNIPQRFGQWTVNGYLNYTNGISSDLRAEDTVWGGTGIEFKY